MRHTILRVGGSIALTAALCSVSYAQEQGKSYLAEHVGAPSDAFELKVGSGYTQGFGNIAPGRGTADVAGPGVGVSVDFDYRMSRPWSIGVEGQYQAFTSEQNSGAQGVAANFGATYHFSPVLRGDPWVRLGTGYRGIWETNPTGSAAGTTVSRHGFELLAAKIGYDIRVSEDVALAPVIGGDLNVFTFEDASNSGGNNLSSGQVASFIYAGLQGRFDIGGDRTGAEAPVITQAYVPALQPLAAPPPAPEPPAIVVSEDLRAKCNLNLEKSPKFEFDQSHLQVDDLDVLRQIAECFINGPMKGEGMVLTGRANPRGTVRYNNKLGSKRSMAVAEYLNALGIESGRLEQQTRGKLDAAGTDEASWANDRRVDISIRP